MDIQSLLAQGQELITVFGKNLLIALVIFVVGRWFARKLSNTTEKVMNKRSVDPTLTKFIKNLVYIVLLVVTVLAALQQMGVETTSFVAIIGAAGLAIGLALQGSLSNFAAGVLMIIFRPVKLGDLVEAAGALGVVEEIGIFTTILSTPDNKRVIIPNGSMTADNIVNYTTNGKIRIDLVFGIGYEDDMKKARDIMMDVMKKQEKVLSDPEPFVGLVELGDNSVNFACRPWCDPAYYWDVYFETMEEVKKRFDAEGISIPYPQRDVHLYQHKTD